jgi:hypothetical protein
MSATHRNRRRPGERQGWVLVARVLDVAVYYSDSAETTLIVRWDGSGRELFEFAPTDAPRPWLAGKGAVRRGLPARYAKYVNCISLPPCPCGPLWINHWERFGGWPGVPCARFNCENSVDAGALVQKDGGEDLSWYVVGLCVSHSKMAETIALKDDALLVPAARQKDCRASDLLVGAYGWDETLARFRDRH